MVYNYCGTLLLSYIALNSLYRLHVVHRCSLLQQMSYVAWCMCMLGTPVSCAKTAELVEMPFGRLTHVDPENHTLDEVQNPHGKGHF